MPLPTLPGKFEVVVAKQEFKFNLAHFVAFKGFRERLHGHNYAMVRHVGGRGLRGGGGGLWGFGGGERGRGRKRGRTWRGKERGERTEKTRVITSLGESEFRFAFLQLANSFLLFLSPFLSLPSLLPSPSPSPPPFLPPSSPPSSPPPSSVPCRVASQSISLKSTSVSRDDGYVLDFGDVKTAVRAICKSLNERVVIPTLSDVLTISTIPATVEGGKEHLSVVCEDGSLFVFPLADCLLLPIAHATVEEMTLYIYGRVLASLGSDTLLSRNITAVRIAVAEAPGQEAAVELEVVRGFDVEEWERTGFNGALRMEGEGVKPCGGGEFGAFFGMGEENFASKFCRCAKS